MSCLAAREGKAHEISYCKSQQEVKADLMQGSREESLVMESCRRGFRWTLSCLDELVEARRRSIWVQSFQGRSRGRLMRSPINLAS
jgi:hypothetical protein